MSSHIWSFMLTFSTPTRCQRQPLQHLSHTKHNKWMLSSTLRSSVVQHPTR